MYCRDLQKNQIKSFAIIKKLFRDNQCCSTGSPHTLAANKKLVFEFWIKVFQTRNVDLAPEYMAEYYIQHNPTVPTGREPFMDFFGQFEHEPIQDTIPNLVYI